MSEKIGVALVASKATNTAMEFHLNCYEPKNIPFGIYSFKKELVLSRNKHLAIPIFGNFPLNKEKKDFLDIGILINEEYLDEYCQKKEIVGNTYRHVIKNGKGIFFNNLSISFTFVEDFPNYLILTAFEDIKFSPLTLLLSVSSDVRMFKIEIPDEAYEIYDDEK